MRDFSFAKLAGWLCLSVLALGFFGPGCGRTVRWPGLTEEGVEICDNGLDDDGDGLVDCNDPECFEFPDCILNPEICNNGFDDDGDGLIDCDDPQCFADPGCRSSLEDCDNGLDDDGDGAVDCDDRDCTTHPACQGGEERCRNKIDDDGDGLVDCDDPDCFNNPQCQPKGENCSNGKDDDLDGLTDCDDPDCAQDPACQAQNENCTNGKDDDGDGLVDCQDPDCFKHPDCKVPGVEVCNNGLDDDEDGAVDCDDPDCAYMPFCLPGQEICDNNLDDDGDGAVDCDDPDCKGFTACINLICTPSVDFGTLNPKGSSSTETISTLWKTDLYTSACAVPGGGEVVATFTLTGEADLKLEYTQESGDQVFALFRAGLAEPCNANPAGCFDPESATTGVFSIKALEGGVYYLIVEAFAQGLEGQVTITLSTGQAATAEICDNGLDDDGDLAIDCADLDCTLDPICDNQLCKADWNLGTLVVNGPAKQATVNTTTASDSYDLTCAGGGGGERVIRFVMPEPAVLGATINQQGWHAFGVHRDMGPGTTCNADPGACFQKDWPGMIIDHGTYEKGVYYYIVEAMNASTGGIVTVELQAHANRGPELCSNGIDDDGDGLVDCIDPDCTGVVGCPGPICIPDHKTGPLAPVSPPVTVTIDTTQHNNDQTVSCALGGGKDAVIEVELTQPTALKVDCTQSGDHVLGLFAQGKPRDPCDASPLGCADPMTGPIGCGFYWGNMQPGKYYLVVEAFKPGDEGLFNITLEATQDFVQEICNNGIDDDGDGLTDCQDYNCSSKPICQGKTCTPDQKLGLLPPAGTPVNAAVTTQGAGDQNAPGCAQGGGEDVVLGFTLVNPAKVQVDFAQFGNHVLALYDNKGTGYACDAAPLSCQTTNAQPTGLIAFSGLQPGEYYLIVEAVAGGSEGSVIMQLSAK